MFFIILGKISVRMLVLFLAQIGIIFQYIFGIDFWNEFSSRVGAL